MNEEQEPKRRKTDDAIIELTTLMREVVAPTLKEIKEDMKHHRQVTHKDVDEKIGDIKSDQKSTKRIFAIMGATLTAAWAGVLAWFK